MRRRSPETLADYLAVAFCPGLIMLLVGSLMWFLVEVFYQGEFKLRLFWVLAMFTIAIVGIARIAMEEGLAYASMFGWALGAAVAVALAQFVKDGLIVGGPLLLLVWWAAHKLTWDCTLIDDNQDASGEGLLQQMGLEVGRASGLPGTSGRGTEPGRPEAYPTTSDLTATTTTVDQTDKPWWETFLEPDRRPHAPGVWVIYFSLAALPLFGLGGWFVPAADPVRRARVFGLLVIYVASGLGLLLATSFLGLRRYLRQRKLEMPLEMTTTWIVAGVIMILATLLAAAVLPRPSREYSLSQLPFTVTSAVRRASRGATGREGTKDDSARNPSRADAKESQATERQGGERPQASADAGGGKTGDQQTSGGKQGQGKDQSSQGKSASERGDQRSQQPQPQQPPGEERSQRRQSNEPNQPREQAKGQSDQRAADQQQPESPAPAQSNPLQSVSQLTSFAGRALFTLLRWLFYVVLLVAGVVAAWVYREELLAAWHKLLAELRDLWGRWFGKQPVASEVAIPTDVVAPPRTFASYPDPFLTGEAARMPWPRLIRYTFEALEAWGREHSCPRHAGQTALEFAQSISAAEPQIAGHVQTLAGWYGQLAYAPQATAKGSAEPLRELWHALASRSARPARLTA